MRSLEGMVAVIAGGSKGIGAGVALALAREGCDLALIARRETLLQAVAERVRTTSRKALVCPGDMAKPEDVRRVSDAITAEYGRVDILYNGIAGNLEKDLFAASPQEIAYFIEATVTGTIQLTNALAPLMTGSGPQIINLISDWAMPNKRAPSTFAAGKYAVLGFGQAGAREAIRRGIRVTNVLPGDTASDFGIDDPLSVVTAKHANRKVPLSDLVAMIVTSLKLEATRVDNIVLSPLNPDY